MEVSLSFDAQAIAGRTALLNAASALESHLESLILVGAQAVYLYTGDADVAIATTTKDSDLAIVPNLLVDDPTLEVALSRAGFTPDPGGQQGKWLDRAGTPVDLLVAAGFQAQQGKRLPRGARIPPHSKTAARNVEGLEGAAVDNRRMTVSDLDPRGSRSIELKVAGPAALVVAKVWKIAERIEEVEAGRTDRTQDKDAHDLYRLLTAVDLSEFAEGFSRLRDDSLSRESTEWAIERLSMYGRSYDSAICARAGRVEQFVGDPELVAESTAAMINELLQAADS